MSERQAHITSQVRGVSSDCLAVEGYRVSFSTDMAKLVADQLARFVTLNRHQLAGQVENLDFWLAQVRHALGVIDGYGVRFIRMSAAQEQYTTRHGTIEFVLGAEDHSAATRAAAPHRVPDRELQKARRTLVESATRFLGRCQSDGLLTTPQWSEACKVLGIE